MIEVPDRDREAGVPEHSLHVMRLELLAEVGGVGVTEPVRVHPLLDPRLRRQALAQLPDIGVAEFLSAARAADGAEVVVPTGEAKRQAFELPALEDRCSTRIYCDDAALVTLAVQDRDAPLLEVDVLGVERERLADPQPGPPHGGDQRPVAPAGGPAAASVDQPVHLVGRQDLWRQLHAFVRWCLAEAVGRLGHGRTVVPASVVGEIAREADLRRRAKRGVEHGVPPCPTSLTTVIPRSTNRGNGHCGRHSNQWGPAVVAAGPLGSGSVRESLPRSDHTGGSGMTGERFTRELRLSSRATQDGSIEVRFLNWVIELEVDQARELQRELTHSIGIATYGRPRIDTHDRPPLKLVRVL